MITIVVRAIQPLGRTHDRVLGTIVVDEDRVLHGDEMLLQTVRGRAGRVAGHTFEERLRGAFPYCNGYVSWDIADAPCHSDHADDQPEP